MYRYETVYVYKCINNFIIKRVWLLRANDMTPLSVDIKVWFKVVQFLQSVWTPGHLNWRTYKLISAQDQLSQDRHWIKFEHLEFNLFVKRKKERKLSKFDISLLCLPCRQVSCIS